MLKQIHNLIKDKRFDKVEEIIKQKKEIILEDNYGKLLYTIFVLLTGKEKDHAPISDIDPRLFSSSIEFSDWGLLNFLLGNIEEAKSALRKATEFPDIDEAVWARLGAIHFSQGELEDARYCWERSLEIKADRVEVLYNLGVLYLNRNEIEKAINYFNRVISINPEFPKVEEKIALAFLQLKRIDEIIEEFYQRIEKENKPDLYLSLGNILSIAGRFSEAISILYEAINKYPDDIRLRMKLIEALKENKNINRAGTLLKEWLEDLSWIKDKEKRNEIIDMLKLELNECRIEAGFIDTAEEDLDQMKKDYPKWYILKSNIYMERNRGEEAKKVLEQGLDKFPSDINLLQRLAHVLTSIGEIEEAKKAQKKLISINPASVINQVEMNDYDATDEQIESLFLLLNSIALPPQTRASAGFTLHRVLDKRKEYDLAFEVLTAANELIKQTIDYDWREHRYMIEKTIEIFTPELVEKLKGLGYASKRTPIFVLGMPRSGTTLTEQIIGSHSLVYPAGELSFIPRLTQLMPKVVKKRWPEAILEMDEKLLKDAGGYYCERVKKLNDTSPFFVDKLPHNFDYIGLILLILPNAKIIHLQRNDMDVALSNYQQNFAAAHGTMGFAFDLKWIGHMLNDHKAIMEHWRKLFPERIYELNYERLTTEPEDVIREVLDFCELPWEDSVLEFYHTKRPVKTASITQVRQKIYKSSVEKWRRYEKYLTPVIDILNGGFKSLDAKEALIYQDSVRPSGFLGVTIA